MSHRLQLAEGHVITGIRHRQALLQGGRVKFACVIFCHKVEIFFLFDGAKLLGRLFRSNLVFLSLGVFR